ncbi:MAG: SDR family oxidoreductase [Eubacteriales bacterium]|nr:SDR family oxidoreductase [Eubacteriales bacterium]
MKKYILVTGASRGIGKSIALKFASEGYHVFLNCRKSRDLLCNVKNTIKQKGIGSCTLVPGDIGDPDDVRKIFQTIHEYTDSLDILVNNAGISHVGLLLDMTDEEWDHILKTNLSSVFYCMREALKDMTCAKSGRIINISSMWGTVGASCEAAYSATKAGIHGLTKAAAKEYAPSGIQINAIACGVIDTEMNHNLSVEERSALAEEIPFGRFATPDEVADLVWKLSDTPSYMTGQIIGIDGGYI